jgi:CRP-like cAMP-binding protein
MRDERTLRIGREIFLAAFGMPQEVLAGWIIDRITAIVEERSFHAGDRMLTEGEPAEFLYFMREGEVRFTREGKPPWTLKGRWVIGGYDIIAERLATRTAVAVGDFRALRVPAEAWVEMLEDSPQMARSAVVNASRALARLEERIPTGAPASPRDTPQCAEPFATLGLVERLSLLMDVRMLRQAGVQVIADLAAMSRPVSFAAGDRVLERGAERERFVQISDGEVLAERKGPDVERHYGAGDLVCGAPVLGQKSEDWEARAVSPVRGIAFPIGGVFDLMEEHFDLVRSAFAAIGARRELLLDHMAAQSAAAQSTELVLT